VNAGSKPVYPDSMRCLPPSLRCGPGVPQCPYRSDAGTEIRDSVNEVLASYKTCKEEDS